MYYTIVFVADKDQVETFLLNYVQVSEKYIFAVRRTTIFPVERQ